CARSPAPTSPVRRWSPIGGTARLTSRSGRRRRGRGWRAGRGTPGRTWRACSSSFHQTRPRSCRILLPRGEYIIVRAAWDRTLTDHELARAARRQVGDTDSGSAGGRARAVVVLSRNLARAGRRGAGDSPRPRRARRDRLPPDAGAYAGHVHPDVPRILRAARLLHARLPR